MRNLITFLFWALSFSASAQIRYFVDQKAIAGNQTGVSWANAFTDLQTALSKALTGDTIWVAAGTYKPTNTPERTVSFVLTDGIQLYGGFIGTETTLGQRDPQLNKTILSGDIGAPGVRTDNAYHVLCGKGLGANTVLDGFYITDGYSYNQFPPTAADRVGAGMLLEGATGVPNSTPIIQNCVFENNQAEHGGGLYVTWTDPNNPSQNSNPVNPILRNCTFSRNRTSGYGAALYKNGPSGPDTFRLEDCRFLRNYAFSGEGGGVYFTSTANSHTIIRRCLFERDTSFAGPGGAISYPANPPENNSSSLLLDSCIFRKNNALEGTGFYYDGYLSAAKGIMFHCTIRNCRFEDNVARTTDGSAFYMFAHDKAKLYVDVEDCYFGGNLASDNTLLLSIFEDSESRLRVNRCAFYNNRDVNSPLQNCVAIGHGGGINNVIITDVTNCLFYKNAGGIGMTSQAENYSTTNVANCTFFENKEYIFIKTWDTLFNHPGGYYNDVFIDNCILWEPDTDLRKMFYNNEPFISNMYGYHVNHTLLSLSDSVSVPGNLEAFGEALIWEKHPGFQDSLGGDFRLRVCSPAVGKGNNQIVADHGYLEDLDYLPRIRFGRVDLGAFEQQDSCEMVNLLESPVYVSALDIWPNPSPEGTLNFQITEPSPTDGLLRIFDVQGCEVFRKEYLSAPVNTIGLRHLPSGFYTVQLQIGMQLWVGKWIRS